MIKLRGSLNESTKSAELDSVPLKAYWADKDGKKIEKTSLGTIVRLYIEKYWAYDAKLKISIKAGAKEEIINEDMVNSMIPLYSLQKQNYIEIELKSDNQYKFLKQENDITLCCSVSQGFGCFYEEDIAEIKVVVSKFCDPLREMQIRRNRASNLFGLVRDVSTKVHQGFDYYATVGTDIIAVANGKVVTVVDPGVSAYGKQLTLKLDDCSYYAFYAHLSVISVKVGEIVKKGDIIGKTGKTGNASSLAGKDLHLHFECRTAANLGKGLVGRESPNNIVLTKFYSQNENQKNQTNLGVIKVDAKNNRTIMNLMP